MYKQVIEAVYICIRTLFINTELQPRNYDTFMALRALARLCECYLVLLQQSTLQSVKEGYKKVCNTKFYIIIMTCYDICGIMCNFTCCVMYANTFFQIVINTVTEILKARCEKVHCLQAKVSSSLCLQEAPREPAFSCKEPFNSITTGSHQVQQHTGHGVGGAE